MPPVEVRSANKKPSSKGKGAVVAIVATVILVLLAALAVLRPVVDRRDGPEDGVPTVAAPLTAERDRGG